MRYGVNPMKLIYLIANITDKHDMSGEEFTWTCTNQTSGQMIPIKKMRQSKTAKYVFIVNAGALNAGEKYTFKASSEFIEK